MTETELDELEKEQSFLESKIDAMMRFNKAMAAFTELRDRLNAAKLVGNREEELAIIDELIRANLRIRHMAQSFLLGPYFESPEEIAKLKREIRTQEEFQSHLLTIRELVDKIAVIEKEERVSKQKNMCRRDRTQSAFFIYE